MFIPEKMIMPFLLLLLLQSASVLLTATSFTAGLDGNVCGLKGGSQGGEE